MRRYGRDFADKLAAPGLQVRHVSVLDVFPIETVERFGSPGTDLLRDEGLTCGK